jgi:hypothetical protein
VPELTADIFVSLDGFAAAADRGQAWTIGDGGAAASTDIRPPASGGGDIDRQRLQARRLCAAELFAAGVGQAEVARRLGVPAKAGTAGTTAGSWAAPSSCAVADPPAIGPACLARTSSGSPSCCCRAPQQAGSPARCGPSRGSASSSSGSSASSTTPPTCGGCCGTGSAGARSGPSARRMSATTPPLASGWSQHWPRIKANARRHKACLVFFDESALPGPQRAPDLGATRPAPAAAPPVQLASCLDGGGAVLRQPRRRRQPCLPRPCRQLRHRHPCPGHR